MKLSEKKDKSIMVSLAMKFKAFYTKFYTSQVVVLRQTDIEIISLDLTQYF